MKTRTNRPGGAPWIALALAVTAAGGTAQAATVQITLNQSHTPASPEGFIDITGDGAADFLRLTRNSYGPEEQDVALYYHFSRAKPAYYTQIAKGEFSYGSTYSFGFSDTLVRFFDSRINDGAETYGILQGTVSYPDDVPTITISRLVFDNASTAAPTEPLQSGDYAEFGATSAVPEPSSHLALLALGSAGLLTRRRTKRKA
jgi:hypothetical protein